MRFGDFEFDPHSGKLFRDGRPVKIQPQPLRVLAILLERPSEIVSREYLRHRIWGGSTFVEFDQGLNYCVRQIRLALRDGASEPLYIETLPRQGYRFIGHVATGTNGAAPETAPREPAAQTARAVAPEVPGRALPLPPWPSRKRPRWLIAAALTIALAVAGTVLYLDVAPRLHPRRPIYTQLTDFTDSAVAPALSPDGHVLAFIRGSTDFLTADQIYVKFLPNGEAKRLTEDGRPKYNVAFSPDGSRIAYTVLEPPNWATYTVPVLGGDSRLFLNNAAGLTWLDQKQLLFSQIRSGMHMGIVTGTANRENLRELYFPAHERGMAHYSYASPDHRSALVVEMDQDGGWAPCRLISLNNSLESRPIGPAGSCRSAGWSPDGSWMYFTAFVQGESHLWRQRFPNGTPEQITFGATGEEGIAVEPDGRSIITSIGFNESAIWIHNPDGEQSMSSEGEVLNGRSPPSLSADGKVLYYLLRHPSANSGRELWRMRVDSGRSEAAFPGISMLDYDVSPDGRLVVFSAAHPAGKSELWLAPTDGRSPATRISHSGEILPHFGPHGQILFQFAEGKFNYLGRMNPDGSGRAKVVSYPISDIQGVSPGRRWVLAIIPFAPGKGVANVAIPVDGGQPSILCATSCTPSWSSNGKFLFIPVEESSQTSPGRSLAIPVGPGETLPEFPPGGIKPLSSPSVIPGARSVGHADLIAGEGPEHFVYVKTTTHRNLYRISLP